MAAGLAKLKERGTDRLLATVEAEAGGFRLWTLDGRALGLWGSMEPAQFAAEIAWGVEGG